MSDLLEQGLFQQLNAKPVSGEHLEVLGKKAAALWAEGSTPTLTQAVTEIVKQAGLSPEQVKRVIEFANTDAFLGEFKKEGAHRVVNFQGGPADPSEILKDLNDGGGGSVFDRGTMDYHQPPRYTKTAAASLEKLGSAPTEDDHLLRSAFMGSESVGYPESNPYNEVFALRDKLASDYENLTSQLSGLETAYADLSDRVYFHVKQAAISGASLGEVVQVWRAAVPSAEHVKIAFQLFTPRLMREEVFKTAQSLMSSLEKTGGARTVNTDHPMFSDYQEYCEVLSKLAELRAERIDVKRGLDELNDFLQKQAGLMARAARAVEGAISPAAQAATKAAPKATNKGMVGRVFQAASDYSEPARDAVHKAMKPVLGHEGAELAGAVAHKAVKYAPHAAAAVGVNEVRRHLKYSPTWNKFQSVANPQSDAYQQREMELAQRAAMGGYGGGY